MTVFSRNEKTQSQPNSSATTQQSPSVFSDPESEKTTNTQKQKGVMAGKSTDSDISIVSKALKITGQLESSEDIQINGIIEGDVRGAFVKIGNEARVKGTVYGEVVEISGTVEGKVEARKVVLESSAHLSGDVVHQDLRIESGAYIEGQCRPEYGKNTDKGATGTAAPDTHLKNKPIISQTNKTLHSS